MAHICSLCGETFTRLYNLKRHKTRKHADNAAGNVTRGYIPYPQTQLQAQGHSLEAKGHSMRDQGHSFGSQGILNEGQGPLTHTETRVTFKHPFTMIVAAPTGFGKTVYVYNLLQRANQTIEPPPERIIICYSHWQPSYNDMQDSIPNIEFMRGIPSNLEQDSFLDTSKRNLIIFDDLMSDIGKDNRMTDLFTKGSHHRNLSVIVLMQNFYEPRTVTMRRNCQYLILGNMPMDLQTIKTMSQRMFPDKPKYMMDVYKEATSKPYGFLVIDLKPTTPDHERLRTNTTSPQKPAKFSAEHLKSLMPISDDSASDNDDEDYVTHQQPVTKNETLLYMKWLQSPDDKTSQEPPQWKEFLKSIAYRSDIDKSLIRNDKALAHLCVHEWSGIRPHRNIPCLVCAQPRVAFELIACDHCDTVDIYLPPNTMDWWVMCKHCDTVWKPDPKQTIKLLVYCPTCRKTSVGKVKNNRKKKVEYEKICSVDMEFID